MKKTLLLLLCLLAALLLTACHVDKDPWPATDSALPTSQDQPVQSTETTQVFVTPVPDVPDDVEGSGNLNG